MNGVPINYIPGQPYAPKEVHQLNPYGAEAKARAGMIDNIQIADSTGR